MSEKKKYTLYFLSGTVTYFVITTLYVLLTRR